MRRHRCCALLCSAVGMAAASSAVAAEPAPAAASARAPAPATPAEAAPPEHHGHGAELLPTMTPTGELPATRSLRAPTTADGMLLQRARELDAVLGDAAQDLGLTIKLGSREDVSPAEAQESRLVDRAMRDSQWQISPRLEELGSMLVVRLVVVPPGSKVAMVRVEQVAPAELPVRAVVMLRDLVRAGRGHHHHRGAPPVETSPPEEKRTRSEGRATLAASAALLGGFLGYALQQSSGSDDARLTYPLLALGAGVGVGASLIIADEWDVRLGDAWFLSAGAVWPTVGGLLLARGRDVQPSSDRWAYGIGGGLAGVTLSTVALSLGGHVSEAGAAVTHSGGALGLAFGGGLEWVIRGNATGTPNDGMGIGAIAGTVLGGILGTQIKGSPSRVLMVDLGGGLGALVAAAAASPLIFGENRTETKDRIWMSATMTGALVGGLIAYVWTGASSKPSKALTTWGYPTAGVIGESQTPDGRRAPAWGALWHGTF